MSNQLYQTIAAEVGVSARTVRRVLSGETKGQRSDNQARAARIRELAERHNFRPNRAASSIRTGRFQQVALVTPGDAAGFLPQRLVHGVEDELAGLGFGLQLSRLPSATLFEAEALPRILAERTVDGLLVNVTDRLLMERGDELAALLARYRLPVVWLNAQRERDAIIPDERVGAAAAVAALQADGHRRIAFFDSSRRGDWHHPASELRAQGYREAMAAAGLTVDLRRDRFVPYPRHGDDHAALIAACGELLDSADAVICNGTREALPLSLLAERAGRRVGRDLGLLVFDEHRHQLADLGGLLVQQIPFEVLGRRAVRELLVRIEDPDRHAPIDPVPYARVIRPESP